MKQITTAMCEAAEGTRFYDRITDAIHAAQMGNQSHVVIEVQSGYNPGTFRLLLQGKKYHVEQWEGTEDSPEPRLYIGW